MNIVLYGVPAKTAGRIAGQYGLKEINSPDKFDASGTMVLVPPISTPRYLLAFYNAMLRHHIQKNADVTIVISDNETTAMTGGQDSAGTGRLEAICAGIGVAPEHIRVVMPLKKNYEEMKQIIREEIEHHGVSVIIPRRECIQTLARKKRNK